MDAVRISDNLPVILKRASTKSPKHRFETDCTVGMVKKTLRSNPSNHATDIYDIIHLPGEQEYEIMVLPLLRNWDSPCFETIGEAVDFFRQIFEVRHMFGFSTLCSRLYQGMAFLHQRNLAHR
jgi:hypothetical protein